MTERTAQKWFKKFRSGNFNLEDAPRSGRPAFDEDALNQLIYEDPRQSTRELEQAIRHDHATVARHLQKMGKVQKLGAWVPHTLKDSHKNQSINFSIVVVQTSSDLYCQQLQDLKAAIVIKRPSLNNRVLLLHDNARPRVAKMTK
ncbi:histone-lysine N-methyltransferase SETMAR-like [Oratosquilla oratoria]|uniref:histone-lysine N-methyltransferase SETMAR-like n=1 Tax=Oratosquilla oratoria TaxID=337810 RepID=UPI003F75BFE1